MAKQPTGNKAGIIRLIVGFRLPTLFCLLLYIIVVLRTAWICDDAYITLRTVDNFVNGFGLTWNIGERVQTYSHPLWMFVLAIAYFVTHEAYLTTLILSILVSITAVSLFAFRLAPMQKMACLGIIALMLSKSFVDYSTSGLENPLAHLSLIIFVLVYAGQTRSHRKTLMLSLVGGSIMLIRLDLILIILPALVYHLWNERSRKSIAALITGFSPFVVWELFSLVYYGFPIPNPAYAKLGTGIAQVQLLSQGVHYFEAVLRSDRLLLVTVLSVLVYVFATEHKRLRPLAIGIGLYLGYIIWIGGCFMVGRFFTAPLFVAVMLFAMIRLKFDKKIWIMLYGLIILIGLASRYAPIFSGPHFGSGSSLWGFGYGIDDERLLYFPYSGLITDEGYRLQPDHEWVDEGLDLREAGTRVRSRGGIGFVGYYAGSKVHIVDILALGDPLLARLPCLYDAHWKPGHFQRQPPTGYLKTLEQGLNRIEDTHLASYYDTLSVITRGPIFSLNRFRIIFNMNVGFYDDLLEKADPIILEADIADYEIPRKAGEPWWRKEHLMIPGRGARINLDSASFARNIELSLDGDDSYKLIFQHNGKAVVSLTIAPPETWSDGLYIHEFRVPEAAITEGFDAIVIIPDGPDRAYALGHIILKN